MTQILDKDTIRNSDLNITGWTLNDRQHKNIKRLGQTLRDVKTKNRIAIKCDKCGARFRTVKGVLPKHGFRTFVSFSYETCIGGKAVPQEKPFKARFLKEVEIKGITYKEGDVVLIEKYGNALLPLNVMPKKIIFEATIAYFMTCENGDVSIRFTYGEEHDKLNHSAYLSDFVSKFDIIKV